MKMSKKKLEQKGVINNFILIGCFMSILIAAPLLAQENSHQASFVYDELGKRDPMWPLVSPNGTIINYEADLLITELILEGIISGEGGSNLAIINGRVLKKNSKLGGYVVSEIFKDSIILIKEQRRFELKLKRGE